MPFLRPTLRLSLWGLLASTAGLASGCIAEAKSVAAAAVPSTAARPMPNPVERVGRWRFTALVEHGAAGRIGSNAQWELSVFEEDGEAKAQLRMLAVEGEPVDPADELAGSFEVEPRPMDSHERATAAGTPWQHARVLEAEVDLQGPFQRDTMQLRVWITETSIVGVWQAAEPEARGGGLLGSARTQPGPLRDLEALPCPLKCAALGGPEAACAAKCSPKV